MGPAYKERPAFDFGEVVGFYAAASVGVALAEIRLAALPISKGESRVQPIRGSLCRSCEQRSHEFVGICGLTLRACRYSLDSHAKTL